MLKKTLLHCSACVHYNKFAEAVKPAPGIVGSPQESIGKIRALWC